jgi:hypothetical protein
VSALTGEGIDRLLEAIDAPLFPDRDVFDHVIPGRDGRVRVGEHEGHTVPTIVNRIYHSRQCDFGDV